MQKHQKECMTVPHKDDPNENITDSQSFKFKARIAGRTSAAGDKKHVEIAVRLKYLIKFWRNLEMLLINCEIKPDCSPANKWCYCQFNRHWNICNN